jgi:hypothetical protein
MSEPELTPSGNTDLTLSQVAGQLGYFVWQLERLLVTRTLPGYWHGGAWMIRRDSLPLVSRLLHENGYIKMNK